MTDPGTPETPDQADPAEGPAAIPAAPDPGPSQPHGDAFLDQSGSRHGLPPEDDDASSGDPSAA
jgi:hypothetical protein